MSYKPDDISKISRHLSESTGNVAPAKQNYEDLVSCSVCLDLFDGANTIKQPKILPCQHTYCVECINHWMHSAGGKFDCPACKFKIDNLKNASDLPTSRIVLQLLEKESLNYQGYASCPCCRQIRNLEVCFECNLPLCAQCVTKHFDQWKVDINKQCEANEQSLEVYKQRVDQINPYITKNFESVTNIKTEIEEAFNVLFQRLNTEKDSLLRTVNEIKDENGKYINFKKDITGLIASFKVFRESNENYDKKAMVTRMKKSSAQFDQVLKVEQDYQALASVPFKIVERFEKKVLPGYDFNFSGILHINEFNLDQNNPSRPVKPHAPKLDNLAPVRSQSFAQQQPTAPPQAPARPQSSHNIGAKNSQKPVAAEAPLAGDPESLPNWIAHSHSKPQSESTISNQPTMMTSYQNLLFTMDQNSFLSIYERAFTAELKTKNSVKLGVPNAKCIAANQNYFAVSYSGLKKEQMKGTFKNMKPSGVVLYRRENFVVCTIFDKAIELKEANESFKSPSGLAMTSTHLLVCDRELKSIFKFDIKTGKLTHRAKLTEGEPNSLSINGSKMIVTDCTLSNLYVFDLETFSQLKSLSLKTIDQISGQFATVLTEEDLIFIKNSEHQLSLLDQNLQQRAYFNEIQARILNIAMVRQTQNTMLVIGCVNNKQQYKLFGYIV